MGIGVREDLENAEFWGIPVLVIGLLFYQEKGLQMRSERPEVAPVEKLMPSVGIILSTDSRMSREMDTPRKKGALTLGEECNTGIKLGIMGTRFTR
jgi:hypothetical protein